MVGVPLQLLENRPDVKIAEMTLASAYYTTNKARKTKPTKISAFLGEDAFKGTVAGSITVYTGVSSLLMLMYGQEISVRKKFSD